MSEEIKKLVAHGLNLTRGDADWGMAEYSEEKMNWIRKNIHEIKQNAENNGLEVLIGSDETPWVRENEVAFHRLP